ncbi:hypothetical protein [Maricaulis sp. CAU 1757]
MTGPYEHTQIPDQLALACPTCASAARFLRGPGRRPPILTGKAHDNPDGDIVGTISCPACGHQARHVVVWPDEAFFQATYRGAVLWAFDRAMAQDLRRWLAAGADREAVRQQSAYRVWLMRVPAVLLGAKARDTVLARLDRLLD